MKSSRCFIFFLSFLWLLFFPSLGLAVGNDYPCFNPSILDLTDRGSVTDTPCVVPNEKIMVEGGYQHSKLTDPGIEEYAPQIQATYGLPLNTEAFILIPSYSWGNNDFGRGVVGTGLGLKKEMVHGQRWIISGQGIIYPPSGSALFGNANTSYYLNALFGFTLSSHYSVTATLGGSSLSNPIDAGGTRFTSFNPSVALLCSPNEVWNFFGEIYSQTKTNVDEQGGVNIDAGIIYVLSKKALFDFELGKQISGNIYGIQNYFNLGFTLLIN